jgi:SAM-dependent methyltransferase
MNFRNLSIYVNNKLKRPVRYNQDFFQEEWFRNWKQLKEVLKELILLYPEWRNILDFGCGPGIMIDLMNGEKNSGPSSSHNTQAIQEASGIQNTRPIPAIEYWGCDYSADAQALYLQRFGLHPGKYLSELPALGIDQFDLFLSFDVFEHLNDLEASQVLEQIAPIRDVLVNISRARFIPGHINLKSDKKWINFFREHGRSFNHEKTKKLRQHYLKLRPEGGDMWHKNIFVFSKKDYIA